MHFILYFILVVLLSPLLIAQGIYTRKKASGMAEPQGERQGITGEGSAISVLILGDSAGAGVGVEQQKDALSGQLIQNLAHHLKVIWQVLANTGDNTFDCLQKLLALDQEKQKRFDYILISLGVNDVTSRVAEKEWLQQCSHLIEQINRCFKPKKIFWSELPPMGEFIAMPQPLRWVIGQRRNMMAKALSDWISNQDTVEVLNFPNVFEDKTQDISQWIAADGFHPGQKVYALWGKIAAERIIADNQSSN